MTRRLSSPLSPIQLMNPSPIGGAGTIPTKSMVSKDTKSLWNSSQGPSKVAVYQLQAESPKVITSMSWRADAGLQLLTVGRAPNWVHAGEPSLDALPFERRGSSKHVYSLLGFSTGAVVEKDGRHWVFFDRKPISDLGLYTVLAVFAYGKYAEPDLQLEYRK